MIQTLCTATFLVMSVSVTLADLPKKKSEVVTIPLDQVWAHRMPGTRSIGELWGRLNKQTGSTLEDEIVKAMMRARRVRDRRPEPSFAVSGTDLKALLQAHSVFVKGTKPSMEFSPEEEITLVFFSEPSAGNRVHLRSITRKDDHFVIRYRLEPYTEMVLSMGFALIPVGKLPVGKYRVEMVQLPAEQKFVDRGFKSLDIDWSAQLVCSSFTFSVVENEDK